MPALAFATQAGGQVSGIANPGPTATMGVLTAGSIIIASVGFQVVTPSTFQGLSVSDNNGNTYRGLGSAYRETTIGSNGWQFFWVPSCNSGSTQAQAQLSCSSGANTCTVTCAVFTVSAWTPVAVGSTGTTVSATNPSPSVLGPLWTPPGKPCLYVGSGIGGRVDFAELTTDGLIQLTPQSPAPYIHQTSYAIEPQQVQQAYSWTLSDNALICSAQIANDLFVGDYPDQLAGRGANR